MTALLLKYDVLTRRQALDLPHNCMFVPRSGIDNLQLWHKAQSKCCRNVRA